MGSTTRDVCIFVSTPIPPTNLFLCTQRAYYEGKFGRDPDEAFRLELAQTYVAGLQWVLYYYFRGVQSWGWYVFAVKCVKAGQLSRPCSRNLAGCSKPKNGCFSCLTPSLSSFRFYPEHYAPFVSDVHGIADFEPTFEMGKAFLPFEQLMAVLPPASRSHVPPAYAVSRSSLCP